MPLQMQVQQATKEHASQTNLTGLDINTTDRFRRCFQIPPAIPVDGIVLGKGYRVYTDLRDRYIIPSLQQRVPVIKSSDGSRLERPVTIQLPPVFEDGTLTIKMQSGCDAGRFQSVLRFASGHTIEYHSTRPDNIFSVVSYNTYLASLPQDVLQRVQQQGQVIVINQMLSSEDRYIGHAHSTLLKLMYDDKKKVIQASSIDIDAYKDHREYWKKYYAACDEAIAQSAGVFFILGLTL